jgi:transcriptional regulator with XRE-family HTH domain
MGKGRKYRLKRAHEEFGRFLGKARERKSLTQREVSLALKYSSPQFISNFERGISLPPLVKLKKLIKIYELNLDEVLERLIEDRRQELVRALGKNG